MNTTLSLFTRRFSAALLSLPLLAAMATLSAAPPDATTPPAGVIVVGPRQSYVNVMKNALPALPTFPKLAPKRGIVRGYVKDANGKPLKGAELGVRSTVVGGLYSGARTKTDANGYYEIQVPWGAAEFYAASITLDYGEGRAAFGLHPADGEVDSFASANGAVENFVLLAYGIADRDKASESPQYSGNYYGGTFTVNYSFADPRFPDDRSLPENSELEVTLTPEGPLLDGRPGKPIVLRRTLREEGGSFFYVNNVPVGTYRIQARLLQEGGTPRPLHLKETGPEFSMPFGLDPKEGTTEATLMFRPGGTQAALAGHGNWSRLAVTVLP